MVSFDELKNTQPEKFTAAGEAIGNMASSGRRAAELQQRMNEQLRSDDVAAADQTEAAYLQAGEEMLQAFQQARTLGRELADQGFEAGGALTDYLDGIDAVARGEIGERPNDRP